MMRAMGMLGWIERSCERWGKMSQLWLRSLVNASECHDSCQSPMLPVGVEVSITSVVRCGMAQILAESREIGKLLAFLHFFILSPLRE